MTFHPVSTAVNTARNDGAALIEPVDPVQVEPESPPHKPEQESLF